MYWHDEINIRWIGGLIICIFCLVGIIIAIYKIKLLAEKKLIFIPSYLLLVICQIQITEYTVSYNIRTIHGIAFNKLCIAIFIPLEMAVLSAILYSTIKSKFIKKFLIFGSFIQAIASVLYAIFIHNSNAFITTNSTTESLILIIPSLYYFYEVLKGPPILKLNKEPAFWTSTGILFFIIIITPFNLALNNISFYLMQSLDYLAYSIIIILFIKAVLCLKKATT